MNIQSHPTFRNILAVLATTATISTGITLIAQETEDEEVFWLSPFEVVTQGDAGYARTNAGTATRISMDIIDTPLAINVISEEFMKDTGRSDLVDVFDYSSSIDTNPDDVMRNDNIKVRGFGVSFVLRDGFKKYYDAPLDAVERVEVVKGPNAVFFGQSQPGGVINYITKSPQFERSYELRTEYGDNDHFKVWVDATGPILKDNDIAAYRVIASKRDSDSWKQGTSWENEYAFTALRVRPFKKMEIKAVYEYNKAHQTGGINTALVGNEDYFRDYYGNEGRDYGYQVNWTALPGIAVYTTAADGVGAMPVRYPWPVAMSSQIPPPETGFGGINPRWEGTITQELVNFFGGSVPDVFMNWIQPDQGIFPEYQRNVKSPFQQDNPIYLDTNDSQNSGYQPGWRILRWFQSGMTAYPNRFNGSVFPNGYNWNPNGSGSFHDTEHHIVTAEVKGEIFSWLNYRYGGNYLENSYFRAQQFNSDTDMDGFTLAPAAGYAPNTRSSPPSASVNGFFNQRYTHQLDFTIDFELGDTTHTFLLTGELREDKFTEYSYDSSDAYNTRALRVTREISGRPPQTTYQEGVAVYDIFADSPPDVGAWVDRSSAKPGGATDYKEEEGIGVSYRGTFFGSRLSVLTGIRREKETHYNFDGKTIGSKKPDPSTGTTPMFGVNYQLKDGLSLYGSYSESFVPPSRPQTSTDLYFRTGPGDDDKGPVIELDSIGPELGIGYEAGIKANAFDGKISGSATVFHLERADIIVTDSNLIGQLRANWADYGLQIPVSWESGSGSPRKNSGTQVSEGIEFDLLYKYRPNWIFIVSLSYLWKAELEDVDTVDFYGNIGLPIGSDDGPYPHPSLFTDEVLYTYTVPSSGQVIEILTPLTPDQISTALGEAESNGTEPINPITGAAMVFEPIQHRELEQVSELRFSFWTRYDFIEGMLEGFGVGFGGNYQSQQRPLQSRDFDYWNPGFWIFDTMISYQLPLENTDITMQLNVNNIFDKRAIDSGAFGINAPRTWKLTATLKF